MGRRFIPAWRRWLTGDAIYGSNSDAVAGSNRVRRHKRPNDASIVRWKQRRLSRDPDLVDPQVATGRGTLDPVANRLKAKANCA